MPPIKELAKIVRSKNAGPFLLTMDVMFEDQETYEAVKATGVLSAELFSELYGTPLDQVRFLEYDTAWAIKCTIPRPIASGDFGDTDVYGCQQHLPLLDVEVPVTIKVAVPQPAT